MPVSERKLLKVGMYVAIVLKKDQASGVLTEGEIKQILTKSEFHPRGIKIKLLDGSIGRVMEILED